MCKLILAIIAAAALAQPANARCSESMFTMNFAEKVQDQLQYLACLHKEQQETIEELQRQVQDLEYRLTEAESTLSDLN